MNSVVIFDLDGTLIDSRKDLTTGVNLMRAEYGLSPLDVYTVADYVGNGARKLAERALKGIDTDVDEALTKMRGYYTEHMFDETDLYPTVKEGLQILKQKGFKTAVCTNKPQEPCLGILGHLGVAEDFDIIMGANPDFTLKPDPAMLEFILRQTGSSPENSWMVGDNYTDLESGRRAGTKTCFCNYGFGYQREESFDVAVDSFGEFAKMM